jgi:hypothetical protein
VVEEGLEMSPIKPNITDTPETTEGNMAIMQSLSLSLTLKKIGVNPALLSALSEQKIELERTITAIIFKKGPGQYGSTQFKFTVPSAVITAAAKGQLKVVYVDILRTELNDFIQDQVLVNAPTAWQYQSTVTAQALTDVSSSTGSVSEIANIGKKDTGGWVKVPGSGNAKEIVEKFAKSVPDTSKELWQSVSGSAWKDHYAAMVQSEPVSGDTIKNALPIPLKSATHIYTPVRGTSEGARYFLVARYTDFAVAVRVKGDSMSVRIEGDLTKIPGSTMNELGFTHGAKGYWSNHLKIKNTDEGQRFLGAVLAGLGQPLTPMPDLKVISMWGK